MPTTKKKEVSSKKKAAPRTVVGKKVVTAEKIAEDIGRTKDAAPASPEFKFAAPNIGAVRDIGVAGSKSTKFPARYSLIPSSGLIAVAEFARSEQGRDFLSLCEEAESNAYNEMMDAFFSFIASNEIECLYKAALGFIVAMSNYSDSCDTLLRAKCFRITSEMVSANFATISPSALRRLAETCGEGEIKYGANNWLNGFKFTELLDHAIAHANSYLEGDESEDHLAHGLWNVLVLIHFYLNSDNDSPFWDIKPQEG